MGFPKYVYKRGTGKKVDDNGLHTAESALVKSEEELAALGSDWCDSPQEAASSSKAALKPAVVELPQDLVAAQLGLEARDEKPAKKVK